MDLNKLVHRLIEYEFHTFVVGVKDNPENKEDIKNTIRKFVETHFNVKYDPKNPDITIIYDIGKDSFEVIIRPLYLYGKYNKYVKIPQSKWPCRVCKGRGCERCNFTGKMYQETVEDLIAKPVLEVTQGERTRFHGAGREDIDVLCYGWREFVIEVVNPKIRTIDVKELERKINEFARNKIEVRELRIVDKSWVRKVKESRKNKVYRVFIEVDDPDRVKDKIKDLEKIFKDRVIEQKTPKRVLHRRSNKLRNRKIFWVKIIKFDEGTKRLVLDIKAEAGAYIKEFVTGDEGRTRPSIQDYLKTKLKVEEMWVISFE